MTCPPPPFGRSGFKAPRFIGHWVKPGSKEASAICHSPNVLGESGPSGSGLLLNDGTSYVLFNDDISFLLLN